MERSLRAESPQSGTGSDSYEVTPVCENRPHTRVAECDSNDTSELTKSSSFSFSLWILPFPIPSLADLISIPTLPPTQLVVFRSFPFTGGTNFNIIFRVIQSFLPQTFMEKGLHTQDISRLGKGLEDPAWTFAGQWDGSRGKRGKLCPFSL